LIDFILFKYPKIGSRQILPNARHRDERLVNISDGDDRTHHVVIRWRDEIIVDVRSGKEIVVSLWERHVEGKGLIDPTKPVHHRYSEKKCRHMVTMASPI
jgi:hypothetical protein